jgi:hypothetical protein
LSPSTHTHAHMCAGIVSNLSNRHMLTDHLAQTPHADLPICFTHTPAPLLPPLQALGFHLGVFHVESKYTSRGPRLIEVNARMGGGPVR